MDNVYVNDVSVSNCLVNIIHNTITVSGVLYTKKIIL
jgi:hypothetical protein